MGGCCSSDEHSNEYYLQQQQNLLLQQQQQSHINYGPLVRDEESIENLPNIVAFGKEVALIDEPVNPQENLAHDGQQYLMQSRVQDYDLLEPVEKSFRAVIASPERTNRVRYVNQVQDGAYVSEPLSDTQKDSRSMELNKNIRTIPLTNQVFPGSAINQSAERPFYNAATNSVARNNVASNIAPAGNALSSNIQNITNTLNNRNNNASNYLNSSSVIANQLTQDDSRQPIQQIQSQIVNNYTNNNNNNGIQQQVSQQIQSQYNNGQQAIKSQVLNQAQQQFNNAGLQQQQAVLQQAAVSQLPSSVQQQIGQYVIQQQIQSSVNNLSNPSGLLSAAAPANNSAAFVRSLNFN